MAAGGSRAERREAVAGFAGKLFDVRVQPEQVIKETLRRIIPCPTPPTVGDLRRALHGPLPEADWEAFSQNPLSAWIEDTFGLTQEEDGHLRRRIPIPLRDGARQLAEQTGGRRPRRCPPTGSTATEGGSENTTPPTPNCWACNPTVRWWKGKTRGVSAL